MLLDALRHIMDLEDPLAEAKKKLCNTYMFVNGVLELIYEFRIDSNTILVRSKEQEDIKKIKYVSLETYLPESGLYPLSSGEAALVIKLPIRQWMKSYHPSFYKYKIIGGKKEKESNIYEIAKERNNRVDIFEDNKGTIWYWDIRIGERIDGKILCLDANFKQELIDWNKK